MIILGLGCYFNTLSYFYISYDVKWISIVWMIVGYSLEPAVSLVAWPKHLLIWSQIVVTGNWSEYGSCVKCHLSVHRLSCLWCREQHPLHLCSILSSPPLTRTPQVMFLGLAWLHSVLCWVQGEVRAPRGTWEDGFYSMAALVLSTADVWGSVVGYLLCCSSWAVNGFLGDRLCPADIFIKI